jgi:hypothetical protein
VRPCRRGTMIGGPDGSAIQAQTRMQLRKSLHQTGSLVFGSTDGHLIQLFHPGTNAQFMRPMAVASRP